MGKFQCYNCDRVVSSIEPPSNCIVCGHEHFKNNEPVHASEMPLDVSVSGMLWIADKLSAMEIALEMNRAIHVNEAEKATLYFAAWLAKNQHVLSEQACLSICYNSAKQTDF